MRQLADRYRDLFPCEILDSVQDPDTGAWRHAWRELMPSGLDVYGGQPAARRGSTATNYALEIMNRRATSGTLTWIRHRDEIGGTLKYEFENCCSCGCEPCYEGVEVTGPALPSIDEEGSWELLDLTGTEGYVLGVGPGDAPAAFDSISGGSW